MTTITSITDFLFATPARRSTVAIIAWWERRRLAYNAWVGAAGIVSLVTVSTANVLVGGAAHVREALLLAAAFGAMANVCYFLGPATELLLEKLWGRRLLPTGPTLFRMGLTFSVGLALFPALLAVMMTVARVVLGILGVQLD